MRQHHQLLTISTHNPNAKMSYFPRDATKLRVEGSKLTMIEPAPVQMGRKRGFFKDEESRILLGLNQGDFMLASGTYGAKELGEGPVKFTLLRDGSYDQHFLPFILAQRGLLRSPQISLHKVNQQWKPATRVIRLLWDELKLIIKEEIGRAHV